MADANDSESGILVYDHPLSPYAQKVKIALLEKGVPFRTLRPEGIGSGRAVAAFGAASPRGEVPALVEEPNVRLFDSTIILEYIEERWPEPALLPSDPLARARQRQLEEVMDTHFEAITWGLAEIRYFGRATGELAQQMESRASEQLRGWSAWLSRELDGREWFAGATFGWGDLCVAPFLNGAVGLGLECEGDLAAWLARVNARDSVRRVREEAEANSFAKPEVDLDALKSAIRQGLFKREYRDHRLEWMIKSGGSSVVLEGLEKDNIRFIDVFRV
jgi:glutathione S-transferase/RNA polymerase-associated protein